MRKFIIFLLVLLFGSGSAEAFLITSDLHVTREAHPALPAIQRDGDAVILLGDSTNNAHAEEHAQILAFLESLGRTAWVIPGNHDLTKALRPADFAEMYAAYGWDGAFSRDTASASCAAMAGRTCLILLDTNAFNEDGSVNPLGGVSEATVNWVREALASLPEGTPMVACGHHPLVNSSVTNRKALLETLREGGVKLYLCGHDHGFAAVEEGGLQQITVGQPQAYPGWVGRLEVTAEGFHWWVDPLCADESQAVRATELGKNLARGTLKGTVHEDDEDAIAWFCEVFDRIQTSRLSDEACERLLSDPAADKWREIETRTVVKKWVFSVLESRPQDVRDIVIHTGYPANADGEEEAQYNGIAH